MKTKIKSFLEWSVLILALILSFSLVKSISRLANSSQKITDAKNKVNELKKENNDLNRQLQTVKSAQFIEGQARDKLGLAKKGEIVVVLPDTNSLKSLAPKLPQESYSLPTPIWQKWLNLFL